MSSQHPYNNPRDSHNSAYGADSAQPYGSTGPGGNAPLLRFDERTGRYEQPSAATAEWDSQAQWGGSPAAGATPQGGYGGAGQGGGYGSAPGVGGGTGVGGRDEVPPGLPPRRTDTGAALPQGSERSHQVEVMQSYEMSRPQTEDEQNQAILQREFPKLDSSLIAAIYGDSGSLSATREMLQELSSGDQ